jgi:hypothetical protein
VRPVSYDASCVWQIWASLRGSDDHVTEHKDHTFLFNFRCEQREHAWLTALETAHTAKNGKDIFDALGIPFALPAATAEGATPTTPAPAAAAATHTPATAPGAEEGAEALSPAAQLHALWQSHLRTQLLPILKEFETAVRVLPPPPARNGGTGGGATAGGATAGGATAGGGTGTARAGAADAGADADADADVDDDARSPPVARGPPRSPPPPRAAGRAAPAVTLRPGAAVSLHGVGHVASDALLSVLERNATPIAGELEHLHLALSEPSTSLTPPCTPPACHGW